MADLSKAVSTPSMAASSTVLAIAKHPSHPPFNGIRFSINLLQCYAQETATDLLNSLSLILPNSLESGLSALISHAISCATLGITTFCEWSRNPELIDEVAQSQAFLKAYASGYLQFYVESNHLWLTSIDSSCAILSMSQRSQIVAQANDAHCYLALVLQEITNVLDHSTMESPLLRMVLTYSSKFVREAQVLANRLIEYSDSLMVFRIESNPIQNSAPSSGLLPVSGLDLSLPREKGLLVQHHARLSRPLQSIRNTPITQSRTFNLSQVCGVVH